MKILMIEDNASLCEGWKDIFELIGHDLKIHPDSSAALKDRNTLRDCDLIITDYYLPDLNGVETIRKIRELRPALPAILLTGSRESAVVQSAQGLPKCKIQIGRAHV